MLRQSLMSTGSFRPAFTRTLNQSLRTSRHRSASVSSLSMISAKTLPRLQRPLNPRAYQVSGVKATYISPLYTGQRLFYASDSKPQSRGPGREIADEADKVTLRKQPENVSMTSSVRPIFEDGQAPVDDSNPDMTAGIRQDFNMIKETFALREVPREVTLLGLAGLVPYVATTATTMFLAWDVKNIHHFGTGYLLDETQATYLLNLLEPIQVGYGAIILGFLGAIHWGLEFAKFGGSSPYTRYIIGIVPAVYAWPTVFMPYDYALLAQFAGFVGMYFTDAQVTTRGWAPRWYTTYRFILTFVVGASIVATLIGRGKIGDKLTEVSSPAGRVTKLRSSQRLGIEEETASSKYQQKLREEEAMIKAKRDAKKQADAEAKSSNKGHKDGEKETTSSSKQNSDNQNTQPNEGDAEASDEGHKSDSDGNKNQSEGKSDAKSKDNAGGDEENSSSKNEGQEAPQERPEEDHTEKSTRDNQTDQNEVKDKEGDNKKDNSNKKSEANTASKSEHKEKKDANEEQTPPESESDQDPDEKKKKNNGAETEPVEKLPEEKKKSGSK